MRKDAGVDGDAQRISQLGWMLFLKIFDEKENDWEILNEDYKSPIPKDLRWRTWAADEEGMTGDQLLDFVHTSWRHYSRAHEVVVLDKIEHISCFAGFVVVVAIELASIRNDHGIVNASNSGHLQDVFPELLQRCPRG